MRRHGDTPSRFTAFAYDGLIRCGSKLFLRVLNKALNKGFETLFPPRHAVPNLLTVRAQRDEFDSGRRLPGDMLAENRDTEAGGNVLNRGSGAINFLDDFWRKSGPLTESRKPGAVTGRIFARGQDKSFLLQLLEAHKWTTCQGVVDRHADHRLFFGNTLNLQTWRRFPVDRANHSHVQPMRRERF
jgi:hypothetical protein